MTLTRVVLDTNCIVSILIFKGVMSRKFKKMLRSEIITPVICPETQREIKQVMAYPKFSLSSEMQNLLLHDILDYAEDFPSIHPIEPVPILADPKDAMFIRLAQKAKTNFLVSGDKHILSLRNTMPELHITSPAQFTEIIGI